MTNIGGRKLPKEQPVPDTQMSLWPEPQPTSQPPQAAKNTVMSSRWLQAYLAAAVRKDLCTKIYCTTCGAMEFRRGVVNAFARATGSPFSDGMCMFNAFAIAGALSEVRPVDPADSKLVGAARCLLFDICKTIGEAETEQVLGDSWGGNVLRGMQEHDDARQAESRVRAADEIDARKRREERKRLTQERHQQRLALKVERDRLWREQHRKEE